MYNFIGRTRKQQSKVENDCIKKGSLWGDIPILNEYVFTKKEFNQVERAKVILKNFSKKVNAIATPT